MILGYSIITKHAETVLGEAIIRKHTEHDMGIERNNQLREGVGGWGGGQP